MIDRIKKFLGMGGLAQREHYRNPRVIALYAARAKKATRPTLSAAERKTKQGVSGDTQAWLFERAVAKRERKSFT